MTQGQKFLGTFVAEITSTFAMTAFAKSTHKLVVGEGAVEEEIVFFIGGFRISEFAIDVAWPKLTGRSPTGPVPPITEGTKIVAEVFEMPSMIPGGSKVVLAGYWGLFSEFDIIYQQMETLPVIKVLTNHGNGWAQYWAGRDLDFLADEVTAGLGVMKELSPKMRFKLMEVVDGQWKEVDKTRVKKFVPL